MWLERLFAAFDRRKARRLERRLREELAVHLEQRTDELVDAGVSPGEARQAAQRRLGNTARVLTDGLAIFDEPHGAIRSTLIGLDHDIRDVQRTLRRRLGFTAAASGIIATAVAGCLAAWAVTDATVFRPLPFDRPEQLVRLGEHHPDMPGSVVASMRSYVEWRDHAHTLSGVAAIRPQDFNFERVGDPQRLSGARVSASYFHVMGAVPIAGRLFTPNDDVAGASPVVIISEALWQRAFACDPLVVGQDIHLDGVSRTLVGIVAARESLPGLGWDDVFVPLALDETEAMLSDSRWLLVTGRLAEDASIDQARAEIGALQDRLRRAWPSTHDVWTSTTRPLHEWLTGRTEPVARVLLVVTALVLAACVSSLLALQLAQAVDRRHETAIRVAMGARRLRMFRLSALEGAVLGTIGGAAGILLARIGVEQLARSSVAAEIPRLASAAIAPSTSATALAAAIASVVAMQLGARMLGGRNARGMTIGARARETSPSRSVRHVQRGLLAGQLAFALFVTVAAVSLVRSFEHVRRVDPGFSPAGVFTVQVSLPPSRYADDETRRSFAHRVLAGLEAVPSVRGAGLARHLPLGLTRGRVGIVVPAMGRTPGAEPIVQYNAASGDYFDTIGVHVLEGRSFTSAESWDSASRVALVNQALAARFFSESPLDHVVRLSDDDTPFRVIGVVADVRRETLEAPAEPELFLPVGAQPPSTFGIAVRAETDASMVIQDVIRAVDPLIPVSHVTAQQQALTRAMAPRRAQTVGVSLLAAVTWALAVLGVYGLMARVAASRTREFGVRLAVGARRVDIIVLMLREMAAIVVAAICVGLALIASVQPVMSSVLYGIDPIDPWTIGPSAIVLVAAAMVSAIVPVHRAVGRGSVALLRQDG